MENCEFNSTGKRQDLFSYCCELCRTTDGAARVDAKADLDAAMAKTPVTAGQLVIAATLASMKHDDICNKYLPVITVVFEGFNECITCENFHHCPRKVILKPCAWIPLEVSKQGTRRPSPCLFSNMDE